MSRPIPFLDINTPHAILFEEFQEVFEHAVRSGQFIGGPMVKEFESDFAKFCDTRYCIGVGSGTDALRFALLGAGVIPGDIVITVPNTFIATTEAITQVGAIPEFIDIDGKTYNMDIEKLREYLETECFISDDTTGKTVHRSKGRRVSAVVPVHLYGQTADMDAILVIAEQFNLLVIEDACQAHGAEYFSRKENRWRTAGSIGDAAAFSFYPGKNLGALGEGGAVTTNNEDIAHTVAMIRDHGQSRKYHHEIEGYNGRLDAIQAGLLRVKLKHLAIWNNKRRLHAHRYNELLHDCNDVITPYQPDWVKPVYHLYVIRSGSRDALQTYLTEHHIATGLHYPIPLHLQNAYKRLGYGEGDFPVTEALTKEIVSLPMFPDISEEMQVLVAERIREFNRHYEGINS